VAFSLRTLLIATTLVAVVLGLLYWIGEALVDRIPPSALTVTAMEETAVRMEFYLQQNANLPKSLNLRERPRAPYR
jgi:hypothetical protein